MTYCTKCLRYGATVRTFKFDPCQLDHIGISGPRPCECVTDRLAELEAERDEARTIIKYIHEYWPLVLCETLKALKESK